MRALLCAGLVGLSLVPCSAGEAATAHRPRARHDAVDRPHTTASPPARFAVPGWSDEATQRWLNNASSNVGRGG